MSNATTPAVGRRKRSGASLLAALALLASACATPVPPTGGPPDQTPPVVEASEPVSGAVNVRDATIRITFSEYVDAASLARALSISPATDGRLNIRWRRRTATVELPGPLRENTTYVLTLDTNLRDVNGVALREPLTLAFSTGPTINRGRLAGRVVSSDTGAPVAGVDVYAYAVQGSAPPSPLPDRPDYRTQTNTSGVFELTYLSEQPYYVVAVQDRNRNRRADALEPFAVPPQPMLVADSSADTSATAASGRNRMATTDLTVQTSGAPWIIAVVDTVPPAPQRARALSDRRFELRFSEPVRFLARDPERWVLYDSLGNRTPIAALYQLPAEPLQVYFTTEPLPPQPYRVQPAALVDTSGNAVRPDTLGFTPLAAADTLAPRFLGFVPDSANVPPDRPLLLAPGTRPGVRFNQPLDSLRLRASVGVQDTTGRPLPYATTSPDGVTYFIEAAEQEAEAPLRIVVDRSALGGLDSLFVRTFRALAAAEVGELSGVVASSDTSATIVVELYPAETRTAEEPRRTLATSGGRFLFRDLPAGTYRLRAFVDRDGDQRWDGGRIDPYVPAEPLAWSTETYRIRPRWETALPDTLFVGVTGP